jgi:NAD(P)-dependent dehydrogenase (short-subunit alcohol dehydrogenase family)
LASVAAAVESVKSQYDRLDILVNNGGISSVPVAKTQDGFEIQFGTNYVGHALLTKLLLPTLVTTATESKIPGSVRIVNLSSNGHLFASAPGINFENLNHGNAWNRYAQSKLANVLHAKALSRRYPTIIIVSLHPGTVRTSIFEKMNSRAMDIVSTLFGWAFYQTIQEGTKTQLWAATATERVESGVYYTPIGVKATGSKYAQSKELEDQLWNWTENEFKKLGY